MMIFLIKKWKKWLGQCNKSAVYKCFAVNLISAAIPFLKGPTLCLLSIFSNTNLQKKLGSSGILTRIVGVEGVHADHLTTTTTTTAHAAIPFDQKFCICEFFAYALDWPTVIKMNFLPFGRIWGQFFCRICPCEMKLWKEVLQRNLKNWKNLSEGAVWCRIFSSIFSFGRILQIFQ